MTAHTVQKVQPKPVASTSSTPNWQIHHSILRPMKGNSERLSFVHQEMIDATDVGVEGDVILMEYDATKAELPVTYVITAIALGHLKRDIPSVQAATALRTELPRLNSPIEYLCLLAGSTQFTVLNEAQQCVQYCRTQEQQKVRSFRTRSYPPFSFLIALDLPPADVSEWREKQRTA
jgi:hypothetical protein